MLYDAVEKVKTLVVISLRGNKLLENSKQTRLRRKVWDHSMNIYSHTLTEMYNPLILTIQSVEITSASSTVDQWNTAITYYFICSGAGNSGSSLLQVSLKQAHQRGDVSGSFPKHRLQQVRK